MTPARIRSDVQVAATLLVALQGRMKPTLDAIGTFLGDIDGWPPGGNAGPSVGNAASPTESAALRRTGPSGTGPLEELGDLTSTLITALKLLHGQCDRWAPKMTASDLERLRCVGTGDAEGSTCTSIADATRTDGRCVQCGPKVDERRRRDAERKRAARTSRTYSAGS